MRLLSFFRTVFTVVPSAAIEVRLYGWISLVAAFVAIGIIVPANLVAGLTPGVDLAVLAFGLVSAGLYLASRRGRHYPKLFSALLVAVINVVWFFDAGADGSAALWFTLIATLLTLFLSGPTRWIGLALFVADGTALMYLDYRFPGLAPRLPTRADRYLDLVTGFPIADLSCAAAFAIVLGAYRGERKRLADANRVLEQTLGEIRTLRGLLPICGWCKKIRDEGGRWVRVEQYMAEHSEAEFSHGICPECEGRLQER